jgi:hypothetical protein
LCIHAGLLIRLDAEDGHPSSDASQREVHGFNAPPSPCRSMSALAQIRASFGRIARESMKATDGSRRPRQAGDVRGLRL